MKYRFLTKDGTYVALKTQLPTSSENILSVQNSSSDMGVPCQTGDQAVGFMGGMITRIGSGFLVTDRSSTWSSSSSGPSVALLGGICSLLMAAGLGVMLFWVLIYLMRPGLCIGLGERPLPFSPGLDDELPLLADEAA
ncbi:hypothetical protein C0J52_21759 [Blattella germanica]|nr:hypothetical protein C0J52_21759 [Blattella germanica]